MPGVCGQAWSHGGERRPVLRRLGLLLSEAFAAATVRRRRPGKRQTSMAHWVVIKPLACQRFSTLLADRLTLA